VPSTLAASSSLSAPRIEGFGPKADQEGIPERQSRRQLPQLAKRLVQFVPAMMMRLFSTGVEQKATTREIL
jgi:hypothetical protein